MGEVDLEHLMIYGRGYDRKPANGYDRKPANDLEHYTMMISGPNGEIEAKVEDVDEGIFKANYPALNSVSGDYTMTAMVNSQPVAKFLAKAEEESSELKVKRLPSSDKSFAQEPCLDKFFVHSRNYDWCPTEGNCIVQIQGPDGLIETKVQNTDLGTYCAQYPKLNSVPGEYFMTAMVDFEPVAKFFVKSSDGSDLLPVVNIANPDKCFVQEPTL